MKVLVTGGSGYLGTHVRRYFAADDLSRRSGRNILNLEDSAIVGEYDVVIHLAALLDKSPEAAEESCPTLYAGQSALEWSKLVAERYVEYYAHQNRFRACILRMSTVYAPPSEGNVPNFVGAFADAINHGDRINLPGSGSPRRDLLHVDDFSSACKAFVDSVIRHGLYNIGGGPTNALSLRELIGKLEEVSGLQAVIDESDPLPDPVPVNYVTDLGRILQELDWKPEISVDEGLKSLF